MARTRILPLVFLLSSALLVGQQTVTKPEVNSALSTHLRSAENKCPINVSASLVGLPSALKAGSSINGHPIDQEPKQGGQLVHLDVDNPSSQDIVSAKFTAHGFSRKWRLIQPSDPSNGPDLWTTVDVALDVQAKSHASSELSLAHFTATLTSIDLNSVTYADGTQWQAPSQGVCSITPNMVVRIASTR